MEKKGIATEKGELNRNIRKANKLIKEIRAQIGNLKEWIAGLLITRSPFSSSTYSFLDFAAHAPRSSRGRIVKRIWAWGLPPPVSCPHAPTSFSDRSTLWNIVELYEKAGNAQLAREVEIALPVELSREEQLRLVRQSRQYRSAGKVPCAEIKPSAERTRPQGCISAPLV